MNATRSTDYGIALLRISLGVMFIAHSVLLKYFTFSLAGTAGYFESIGLPGFLAYVVFGMEAVGGILLVLGIVIVTQWPLPARNFHSLGVFTML